MTAKMNEDLNLIDEGLNLEQFIGIDFTSYRTKTSREIGVFEGKKSTNEKMKNLDSGGYRRWKAAKVCADGFGSVSDPVRSAASSVVLVD